MSNATPSIITTGSTAAFEKIIHQPTLSVVDFWAPWCAPCQAYGPTFKQFAESSADEIHAVKVNVDDGKEIAQIYGIRSIPTTLFFRDGKEVARKGGMQTLQQLNEAIEALQTTA